MEKRSIIVCVGGQKGGTGKTLNATNLGSYIEEKTDYSVIVVDADDKQRSIVTRRQMEIDSGLVNGETKTYTVCAYDSAEAGEQIFDNEFGLYDFIIVDFPGTLSQEGVIGAYAIADIIFIPVDIISPSEIDSTIKFCMLLTEEIDPFRKEKGFPESVKYFLFNKVQKSLKEFRDSKEIKRLKDSTPFPTLNNMLPYWKMFKSDWQTYEYPKLEDGKRQKIIDNVYGEMFEKLEVLHKELNNG